MNKIQITYYTDPLCCWSWALEPQWKKFAFQFRRYISYRYCLCGLIPDVNKVTDDVNRADRSAQLGTLWTQVQQASVLPITAGNWHLSPPSSSFHACIAVKCAFLQSEEFGETFLRTVRENVMVNGFETSCNEVLINIAQGMAAVHKTFDLDRFLHDYQGTNGKDAFRKDWFEARGRGISRFPTIVLDRGNGERVLVSGYNTFSTLRNALLYVAPQLAQVRLNASIDEYRQFWPFLTPREESEFTGQPVA